MAKLYLDEIITFDDVLLIPQYSELLSRKEADTTTQIGGMFLSHPVISANMDSVTGPKMALAMYQSGGLGILHRYADPKTVCDWIKELKENKSFVVPSIGIHDRDREIASMYAELGIDGICIDVAHGDSKATVDMIQWISSYTNIQTIIAGNVATSSGAKRLADAGANVIKLGVGNGAACQTRGVTGHGYPQLSAIIESAIALETHHPGVKIIADGGIKSSGDIVKALAAGASAVMLGGLLAGTDECPIHGIYRGMASEEAQLDARGQVHNDAPEGISMSVSHKGPVLDTIKKLVGGIRSGMSYSGVRTITELQKEAVFVRVSSNTVLENATRKV